jgi:hypothetical protein
MASYVSLALGTAALGTALLVAVSLLARRPAPVPASGNDDITWL